MMQHFAVAFACRKTVEGHSYCVYAQLLVQSSTGQLEKTMGGVAWYNCFASFPTCMFARPFTCGISVTTDPASPELVEWNSRGMQVV